MKKVLKVLTVCSLLSLSVFSQENRSDKDLMKKEKFIDKFEDLDRLGLIAMGQVATVPFELGAGTLFFLSGLVSRSGSGSRIKPDLSKISFNYPGQNLDKLRKEGIKMRRVGNLFFAGSGLFFANCGVRIYLVLNDKSPGMAPPLLKLGTHYGSKVFEFCTGDEKASGEITENDKVFTKEEAKIDVSSRDLKKEIEKDLTNEIDSKTSQKKV